MNRRQFLKSCVAVSVTVAAGITTAKEVTRSPIADSFEIDWGTRSIRYLGHDDSTFTLGELYRYLAEHLDNEESHKS